MNEHFLNGFVKAAQSAGMSDVEIKALLKQANPAAQQEEAPMAEAPMAEAPMAEAPMAEAPMAEAPMAEAPMSPEGGEEELNQLLAQLSPEEIEQLAQELAAEMGGESEGSNELEQIPELAAAIEQQLGQNPEVAEATAPSPEMTEEVMAKQSAINFIKSAEYVEGFLEQAVGRGMNLKQAVELYDSAFSTTFKQLKTSQLKGDQHKLDLDGDGKIEGDDLKKLREGKKTSVDEKTAAYYEGVLERCREYGLSDTQALEIVKNAKASKSLFEGAKNIGSKAVNYVKDRPARSAAIGAGVTAAGLVGYNALKKDDKEEQE